MRAKIYGAGSAGNHIAYACRQIGWNVVLVGKSNESLRRTKDQIYPTRYGTWDSQIGLCLFGEEPKGGFDIIFICTPPDTHIPIAIQVLKDEPPKVLQIEKPFCCPSLDGVALFLETAKLNPQTDIVVGYNHVLGENTEAVVSRITDKLGKLLALDVVMLEDWRGIFAAHPWLSGPEDTYLGFWEKGGGAGSDYSHALNLWQYFSRCAGAGRVEEVSATFDLVKTDKTNYDRQCLLTLATERGLVGRVAQDLVTYPPRKEAALQFEHGSIRWFLGLKKETDGIAVFDNDGVLVEQKNIAKRRPDDFLREIQHIEKLLKREISIVMSPINLRRGLDTMFVLEAAHRSYNEKRVVRVKYFQ